MVLDILNAVSEHITTAFSGVTVYKLNKKDNYERPSFFIYVDSLESKDLNKWIYNYNVSVKIIHHATLDETNNIDVSRQLGDYDKLKSLFQKGYVVVKDRFAPIRKLEGGMSDLDMFLTVNIDITGAREETASYDLMKEVNLVQQLTIKEE